MGTCKTWSSAGLCFGSITVSHLHNDFSLTISKIASPILFADDTSIIISNTSPEEFKSNISLVFQPHWLQCLQGARVRNWTPNQIIYSVVLIETINLFQRNLLALNCDKTHFLQFLTKKT
jgi:hypothetical protein